MSLRTVKTIGSITAGTLVASTTAFIAVWEGKENKPYLDPVKIPTVCYGFTNGVDMKRIYTDAECIHLLEKETMIAVRAVERHVRVPLPPARKAALTSFVYNAGEGNFSKSTLLRKLNAGDVPGACDELRRWVYAKGKKLNGLVNRREAERELCLREGSPPPIPLPVAHKPEAPTEAPGFWQKIRMIFS